MVMTATLFDHLRVSLLKVALTLRLTPGENVRELRLKIEQSGVDASLFVCTTPRSGSNLLDGLLASTGLVGEPAEDFGSVFETHVPPVSCADFGEYLLGRVGRARGGVFSMKLHGYQRDRLVHLLGLLRGGHRLSPSELISATFPDPHYVWLRRRDVVAQAVSWWKARQSGMWMGPRSGGRAEFDFDGIDATVQRVRKEANDWQRWFSTNGIEPLKVSYEQLDGNPAAVVREILAFVGVDTAPDPTVNLRTVRQADAVNAEWIRRYREQAAEVARK